LSAGSITSGVITTTQPSPQSVKNYLPILLSVASLAGLASTGSASTSGLNNIPTADTAPQGTFVLQAYSTVFGQADGDFNIGFKTGIDFKYAHIELGADSHLIPGNGGPVTAQGKLAVPLGEHLPTLAAGVANITFRNGDRLRAGDEFFYAVATEDLGWFRVHGGCGMQDSVALPFAGIDKTFRYTKQVAASDGKSVADSKSGKAMMTTKAIDLFTLRGDAIEQRDSSWLYSAGVLVPVCKHFVLETWANFPDNGTSPSWTIKGNFVFTF
jgi:hypothetical protein